MQKIALNHNLSHLATSANLDAPTREPLRLAFGLSCASRVQHLLEDPQSFEAEFAWQVEKFSELAGLDASAAVVSA